MNQVFLFILIVLASYRMQRILTEDQWPPSVWLRDWVVRKWGTDSSTAYFATCPWCVGFWASGLVVLVVGLWGSIPAPLLWWGASSAVVGFLAENLEGD